MTKPLAIGDMYPVWWETFNRDKDGNPIARVMDIKQYTGRYTEHFTHDLKLDAPNTRNGYLIMSVKLD